MNMAAWTPDSNLLGQVVHMLTCAMAPDTTLQKGATEALDKYKQDPQFALYLSYILARNTSQPDQVRYMAGLVLKRSLEAELGRLSEDVSQVGATIRSDLLSTLQFPNLQAVASNCIATVIRNASYSSWPTLPPVLSAMLSSGQAQAVGAGLATCVMLAEDMDSVDDEDYSQIAAAVSQILPHLVPLMQHPAVSIRVSSCKATAAYLAYAPVKAWEPHAQAIFAATSTLTGDTDEFVLTYVLAILELLVQESLELVLPHMHAVLHFSASMLSHGAERVALQAAVFWTNTLWNLHEADGVVNLEARNTMIKPFLSAAIPSLMDKMQMSEEELSESTWVQGNDAHIADTEQQIRPFIRKGGSRTGVHAEPEDEAGGDGDERDQSDPHQEVTSWSVRKQAATALEAVAETLDSAHVLAVALPQLQKRLAPPEAGGPSGPSAWLVREAAVLALGTMSRCDGEVPGQGLTDHLPVIMPFLLGLTQDAHVMLRSTTIWAIGRFTGWILHSHFEGATVAGMPVLSAFLQVICACMLDSSKKAQTVSLTALGTCAAEMGEQLAEHTGMIWETCIRAYSTYQVRNRIVLCDVVGAVAEAGVFTEQFDDAHECQRLLGPMLMRWAAIKDKYEDPELVPLLESLSKTLAMSQPTAAAAVTTLLPQLLDMMSHNLVQLIVAEQSKAAVKVDTDLVESALDVVCSLVNVLGPAIAPLLQPTALMEYVLGACSSHEPQVRQSGFALVGDLATQAYSVFEGHEAGVLEAAAKCLIIISNGAKRSAANNAVWAVGCMLKAAGPSLGAQAGIVIPYVASALGAKTANTLLLGNCSCTLGRLAMLNPSSVAHLSSPAFSTFVIHWAKACTMNEDAEERPDAFRGLLMAVGTNPAAILSSEVGSQSAADRPVTVEDKMVHLGVALAHLEPQQGGGSSDVLRLAAQVLQGLKGSLPADAWGRIWSRWNDETQRQMSALL